MEFGYDQISLYEHLVKFRFGSCWVSKHQNDVALRVYDNEEEKRKEKESDNKQQQNTYTNIQT